MRNIVAAICIFSLIIVKSLQLRGRKQIAESRKYCLVRVIVFLWRVFSLFLFLTGWEFRANSLHDVPKWSRPLSYRHNKMKELYATLGRKLGNGREMSSHKSNFPIFLLFNKPCLLGIDMPNSLICLTTYATKKVLFVYACVDEGYHSKS